MLEISPGVWSDGKRLDKRAHAEAIERARKGDAKLRRRYPMGWLGDHVEDFLPGGPLRRAYAETWMPVGPVDFVQELETKKQVRVLLRFDHSYYLNEPRERVVVVRKDHEGEVFARAAEFYRDLYREDGRRGGGAKIKGMKNRACSPLIWGHDLGDLAFEGVWFVPVKTPRKDRVRWQAVFDIGS